MARTNRNGIAGIAIVLASISAPAVLADVLLLGADFAGANLLEINPQTGAGTAIGPFSHPWVASLAYDSQAQILYATTSATSLLLQVNPDTGATTQVGPLGVTCCMHGLAYNPNNNVLYGARSGNPAQLYQINKTTGVATFIASIAVTGICDLAFDPAANVMYLSEINQQRLHTVNLTTGALTLIGPFNAPGMPFPQVGVGMAFDPVLGLFATDNTGLPGNNNPLYRINTTNGQATLIGFIGATNVLGLAFVPGTTFVPGDLNCDGAVDFLDVAPFVLALIDPAAYDLQFPACDPDLADVNGDGDSDGRDVGALVTLLIP